MKSFIQIIFFIILFFNLLSCNTYQRRAKNIIQTWNGKKIIFTPLNAKIMGEDTIIPLKVIRLEIIYKRTKYFL